MTLPLQGMTVLDLSRLLPGPLCSLHLQDMGARVIKVEDTHGGDYARTLGMPAGLISPIFHILNRGKESISVDFQSAQGCELLRQLIAQADILLESFRPGVMDKLGLSFAQLQKINPLLVMCSISGYGQTGPWAHKAGHDMNYCASAGILDQCGVEAEGPVLANFQIADIVGGTMSAAVAILGGVIRRLRYGMGCYLDISMTDCAFANHIVPLAAMNLTGQAMPPGQDMLTGARPCYSVYATADKKYMAVAALEEKFWVQVCDVLGYPQWRDRYHQTGVAAAELKNEVAAVFAEQPQSHWRKVFVDTDCCVTPILTPAEAFEHPQLLAREMINTITTKQYPALRCPAPAITFTDKKVFKSEPGPDQGQHTLKVLQQLNCTNDDINRWLEQGIVRQP